MSSQSYSRALKRFLSPRGFFKSERGWTRLQGPIRQTIFRYTQPNMGSTIEYNLADVETEALFLQIFPEWPRMPTMSRRVGQMMTSRDPPRRTPWWMLDDPEGPRQMIVALEQEVLPWFDRPWPLEAQAEEWFFRDMALKGQHHLTHNVVCLSLTLHRMGAFEDVRLLLDQPLRSRPSQSEVEMIAKVREALGY